MKLAVFTLCLVLTSTALSAQALSGEPAPPQATQSRQFDSKPWLDDFHELTAAMGSHYADLEWAVNDRHMNLPKLRQAVEDRLRQSPDEQTARNTLEQFLDAFGDGHLSITWPKNEIGAPSEKEDTGEPLCHRLGYKPAATKGIDFSLLPGFSAVPGNASELYGGGLLALQGGKKIGVIRIAYFDEHGFPSACEDTIKKMQLSDASACDRACARTIALSTINALTRAIVNRAEQLRSLGASALLVDVTHNDGGDDWNEAVARSLSSIPLVDEHQGFLKHKTWTTILENALRSVEADLSKGAGPRDVLEKAAEQLRTNIAQSKEPCDNSHVFEDGRLTCSFVVNSGRYWSGILAYAKPDSFATLGSKTTLFRPLEFDYVEGANRLPLLVVVDAHSWSSAERFAALLQDNGTATIIGELTGGAGCGFINGGIPTTLTHSNAQVRIPNCVGFRKDGSNANDGVTPDILVPWAARDTAFSKAAKLMSAIRQMSDKL
jgi:hypothetical protein